MTNSRRHGSGRRPPAGPWPIADVTDVAIRLRREIDRQLDVYADTWIQAVREMNDAREAAMAKIELLTGVSHREMVEFRTSSSENSRPPDKDLSLSNAKRELIDTLELRAHPDLLINRGEPLNVDPGLYDVPSRFEIGDRLQSGEIQARRSKRRAVAWQLGAAFPVLGGAAAEYEVYGAGLPPLARLGAMAWIFLIGVGGNALGAVSAAASSQRRSEIKGQLGELDDLRAAVHESIGVDEQLARRGRELGQLETQIGSLVAQLDRLPGQPECRRLVMGTRPQGQQNLADGVLETWDRLATISAGAARHQRHRVPSDVLAMPVSAFPALNGIRERFGQYPLVVPGDASRSDPFQTLYVVPSVQGGPFNVMTEQTLTTTPPGKGVAL